MIELQNIATRSDRDLVISWFERPHVMRWWGTPEDRIADFDSLTAGSHALIIKSGIPIGYLRWEVLERKVLEEHAIVNVPEGSIDVDILIGEATELGKGVGPAALEQLCSHLSDTTSAPAVGLCTSTENSFAIRAYEKAGFKKVCKFEEEEFGPMWVMLRNLR